MYIPINFKNLRLAKGERKRKQEVRVRSAEDIGTRRNRGTLPDHSTKSKRCQFLIDSLNDCLELAKINQSALKSLQVVSHRAGDNSPSM